MPEITRRARDVVGKVWPRVTARTKQGWQWLIAPRRIAPAIAAIVPIGAFLWAVWWLWSRLAPQWDPRTIMAIVIVVAPLLTAIWWLWWRLPRRQVARLSIQIPDPKARADTEDNFRKTVGQALGGAAVLIGAVAAYLQFTQQQQASHDLLISNQVSKGFEQLASDKIPMRLGGLYALEGVMNGSEQYHQPVLEALCAFVRDDTIGMIVSDQGPATDIQAALTVIGRRKSGSGTVDLTQVKIPNANLSGANLSDASLFGAHLEEADLNWAHLEGATLKWTYLNGADLNWAHLEGANFDGAHLDGTDLSDANLSNAQNLTQSQLDKACGADATLPKGLTLKNVCSEESWSKFRTQGWRSTGGPGSAGAAR